MNPIASSWLDGTSFTNYGEGQSTQQWIDNAIARATSKLTQNPPNTSSPLTTTWTSSDGPHTVSTAWDGTETTAHWIDRHFADVRTQLALHPPTP